jgi:predicted lipoprotein with Yx(FWY)xxD motif
MALIVAGCGSSGSGTKTTSSASAGVMAIGTASGSHGTYLTGAGGRALYLWVADPSGKSVCSGACAKVWIPVVTKAAPTASGSAVASDLSTTTRSNGTKQVTYKGHPLYYFVGDSHAGTFTGEGSNGFGHKWWLVAPSGSAIMKSAAAASSSTSGSGGGY